MNPLPGALFSVPTDPATKYPPDPNGLPINGSITSIDNKVADPYDVPE